MSRQREVECLERLQQKTAQFSEILDFLQFERLMTPDESRTIIVAMDKANRLQLHLANLKTTEKLQLLDYEWTILPVERISLTIVTDRSKKEFTWNI